MEDHSGLVISAILATIGFFALDTLKGIRKSADEANKNFKALANEIGELKIEVVKLSGKVSVVIEKTEKHDTEIIKLKEAHLTTRERVHTLANDINGINAHIHKE